MDTANGAGANPTIQVISFDLDGTLVEDEFDRAVWFEEIPRRYGAKHGLPLAEAQRLVFAEYSALKGHSRWTDMAFWCERFGLDDWQEMALALAPLIRPFPETLEVLRALRLRYRLIIITQAERKFLELKLRVGGLAPYFEAAYSTPDHFQKLEKDEAVYAGVLRHLGIAANQMLHVGDHWRQDYELPMRVGIAALLLDRCGKEEHPDVIRDLRDLLPRLLLL